MEATRRGGWSLLSALLMVLIGLFGIFEGATALRHKRAIFPNHRQLALLTVHSWGWILVILGIVTVLAACVLLLGLVLARVVAIVLVMLNTLAQVALIGVQPWLSLIMVGVSALILGGLTVGHRPAAAALPATTTD